MLILITVKRAFDLQIVQNCLNLFKGKIMVTVESALEDIMKLDFTSREMVLEILQKRQIEARRSEMAKNAKQSVKDYQSGKIKPIGIDEVLTRLNNL